MTVQGNLTMGEGAAMNSIVGTGVIILGLKDESSEIKTRHCSC